SGTTDKPFEALRLQHVVAARFGRLPEEGRRLLEVVSTAGRPIPQRVALEAAAVDVDSGRLLTAMRGARLIRTRGAAPEDAIEAYHDRIRETVVKQMVPDRARRCHARLGAALESWRAAPADMMSLHFELAGQLDKGAHYARLAADNAESALAFDRAAELHRRA